jgi:hypothetical protein
MSYAESVFGILFLSFVTIIVAWWAYDGVDWSGNSIGVYVLPIEIIIPAVCLLLGLVIGYGFAGVDSPMPCFRRWCYYRRRKGSNYG